MVTFGFRFIALYYFLGDYLHSVRSILKLLGLHPLADVYYGYVTWRLSFPLQHDDLGDLMFIMDM